MPIKKGTPAPLFETEAACAEKLRAYFEEYLPESGEVADVEGLADYLGGTRGELVALLSDARFGPPLRRACNRIAKIKKQLAFRGALPAAVLAFDFKNNHGYRDRPEEARDGGEASVVLRGKAAEWGK